MNPRQQESTRIPLDPGHELQAYVSYTGQPAEWAVVFVHGLGSQRTGEKPLAVEAACARRGWTFASFDFRGHGESTGTLLEMKGSALLEDLEALRVYLATRGVRRLALVGSSMGGWAAAWFAVRCPEIVSACVLIAPAIDFLRNRWTRLSEAERQSWRETGRHRIQNEWMDTEIGYALVEEIDLFPVEFLAERWNRPLLIFHGMLDDTIPYTHSLALVEQAAYPQMELRLYKNGDHRLVEFKDEIAETACQFLGRWAAIK